MSRTFVMTLVLGAVVFATGATPHGQQADGSSPATRAVTVTAGAEDLRVLVEWDRQVTRLSDAGTLRLATTREDTLIAGRSHERFDQYYQGVRVFGAQLVRQMNDGQAVSVFGSYHPNIAVDTHATLSEDDALARAKALTGGVPLAGVTPQLVVLPKEDGSYALTWNVRVWTGNDLVALFIDAHSGVEAFRYSDLQKDSAVGTSTGVLGDRKKISTNKTNGTYLADDKLRPPSLITYDLHGNYTRANNILAGITLPGQSDIASDTDNSWTDGAAADAHVYLGYTYDYYFKRFGRKGLDNNNRPIVAIVHPVNRSEIDTVYNLVPDFYLNAFWCGDCAFNTGMMLFGEGLPPNYSVDGGQYVNYFSGALDIVGHELSHAVTQYTSNLIYFGESGALNEAFSDMMGISIEFYFQPPGNGQLKADYLLGEDVFVPSLPGSHAAIRSAVDPLSFGDPDHYSRRYTGFEDNGGVHINSLIATHAFYLAIEGGTNRTSGRSVQGVGGANREQIEKVFYRGFTQLLPSNATFAVARRATLQAATDLYGTDSPAFRAVSQAWDAVGVF